MESKKFKCILSGDSRVGKTSLIKTYLEGKFPSKIQGFNDVIVNKKFSFDGKDFFFEFKDIADDPEEEKAVDFSIVCLSLNDNKSIQNAIKKWASVFNLPFYILGLKQDLIFSEEILSKIKSEVNEKLKDNKHFLGYQPLSAKNSLDHQIFEECCRLYINNKMPEMQ